MQIKKSDNQSFGLKIVLPKKYTRMFYSVLSGDEKRALRQVQKLYRKVDGPDIHVAGFWGYQGKDTLPEILIPAKTVKNKTVLNDFIISMNNIKNRGMDFKNWKYFIEQMLKP